VFDYLMGCDLDMEKPEVQEALKKWGKWYVDTTNVDGISL
jgi:alpha-amylase